MQAMTNSARRLHTRGSAACGLVVDANGVMLGPDYTLVRRDGAGYARLGPEAAAHLLDFVFDTPGDPGRLLRPLDAMARALGAGDLVKAQLLGLLMPLDTLDRRQLVRLAIAVDLAKESYDPTQPRDGQGRWTAEGDTVASVESQTAALRQWAGRLAPLARYAGFPTLVVGGLFVPANWAATGTLPDRPDIGFRYAEGDLWLYRTDSDGMRRTIFSGVPGLDGIYRDKDGKPIGREAGKGFIVDPAALPGAASITQDDQPKLCPDPGPDRGHGASDRANRYQTQITGLPLGLAITLNDVTFDGCRESDGTMLEAKGPGYAQVLAIGGGKIRVKAYYEMIEQAESQVDAAGNRRIEWHFAEKAVADFFRSEFGDKGFSQIEVIYTAPEDN